MAIQNTELIKDVQERTKEYFNCENIAYSIEANHTKEGLFYDLILFDFGKPETGNELQELARYPFYDTPIHADNDLTDLCEMAALDIVSL